MTPFGSAIAYDLDFAEGLAVILPRLANLALAFAATAAIAASEWRSPSIAAANQMSATGGPNGSLIITTDGWTGYTRSTDGGQTWNRFSVDGSGDQMYLSMPPDGISDVYAVAGGFQVFQAGLLPARRTRWSSAIRSTRRA